MITPQQRQEIVEKVLSILARQQSITNQGINYSGEKDWALNRILELLDQELAKQEEGYPPLN